MIRRRIRVIEVAVIRRTKHDHLLLPTLNVMSACQTYFTDVHSSFPLLLQDIDVGVLGWLAYFFQEGSGGGIFNRGGTVLLTLCTVHDNTAVSE